MQKMEPNYLAIPGGVGSQKRSANSSCFDEPDPKRPAFSSVMAEALKIDTMQILCSVLEPTFRRIVREELDAYFAKQEARKGNRNCPERALHLRIDSPFQRQLYTGDKISGVRVSLIDSRTGEPFTGVESNMALHVVVVNGDFNKHDSENWSEEEFDSFVVGSRDKKPALISGSLNVIMRGGAAEIGELTFSDNSSWVRSKKFRLGIKAASECRVRVREAVSDEFAVLDQRGAQYQKHYPPLPNDEVWRLEKIRKGGDFHRRLNEAGIHTVEKFLHRTNTNEEEMRRILGMSGRNWKSLCEHARKCVLPQSGNGVYDLQQQWRDQIQRPLCVPQMNRRDEECLQYFGNAVQSQSADMHQLVSSGAEGRALPYEGLVDNSMRIEDMDCYWYEYDAGEECSNRDELPPFESVPGFPGFGNYVPPCSSSKAVIGWLKLKAALQWGIFVKKKAAQRRAQITEL